MTTLKHSILHTTLVTGLSAAGVGVVISFSDAARGAAALPLPTYLAYRMPRLFRRDLDLERCGETR